VASLERARSMRRLFQLHRHGPGLLVGLVIVSSWRRDSSRASNIQYSAIFSYALFMDGSLACAARCLASSALRRQVSLSDDIRGGSLNAPEPSGKCGLHGRSESPNPTNSRHAFYANNVAATSTIAKTNAHSIDCDSGVRCRFCARRLAIRRGRFDAAKSKKEQ
jgi:hypothetical protein